MKKAHLFALYMVGGLFSLLIETIILMTLSQEVALSAYGSIDVSSQLMRETPIDTPSGQVVRLSDVTSFLNLVREDADTLSRYNGEESYLLGFR